MPRMLNHNLSCSCRLQNTDWETQNRNWFPRRIAPLAREIFHLHLGLKWLLWDQLFHKFQLECWRCCHLDCWKRERCFLPRQKKRFWWLEMPNWHRFDELLIACLFLRRCSSAESSSLLRAWPLPEPYRSWYHLHFPLLISALHLLIISLQYCAFDSMINWYFALLSLHL